MISFYFLLLLQLLRQSSAQIPVAETDSALIARLAAAAAAAAIPSPEQEEILSPQRSPLARDLQQVCQTTATPGSKPDLQGVLGPVRTVNISTGEFAYVRFGNMSSSRPPLVFITGFGSTLSWLPLNVVLELAKDQEIIAFDNRGMGLSKDTSSLDVPLTIPGMANDTAEIISALNLTKPTVMGVSMGGMIATALVVNHGEDLGVVVVAHGAAGGANSTAPSIEAVDALKAPSPPPLAYLDILWDPKRPGNVAAACHAYSFTIRNPIQSPTNSTTIKRQTDAVTDWFLGTGAPADQLARVSNPMLLVGGSDDAAVPPANLKHMAGVIPTAWLGIFPGRHAAFAEYGTEFVQLFNAFFGVYGSSV